MIASAASRSSPLAVVLGTLLALAPAPALAGPINTDKPRSNEDEPGLSTQAGASVAVSAGNVRRSQLALSGSLGWQRMFAEGPPRPGREQPPWLRDQLLLVGNALLITAYGQRVTNSSFAHGRWVHAWHPRLFNTLFSQIQYDEQRALQRRVLLGLGLGLVPVHRRRLRLRLSTGYMVEFERNRILPGDTHPVAPINHRMSNVLIAALGILPDRALQLRSTTYFQPRFDAPSDFRMLESVQLEGAIDRRLALGLDASFEYDSRPPLGVRREDITVSSYIRVALH